MPVITIHAKVKDKKIITLTVMICYTFWILQTHIQYVYQSNTSHKESTSLRCMTLFFLLLCKPQDTCFDICHSYQQLMVNNVEIFENWFVLNPVPKKHLPVNKFTNNQIIFSGYPMRKTGWVTILQNLLYLCYAIAFPSCNRWPCNLCQFMLSDTLEIKVHLKLWALWN